MATKRSIGYACAYTPLAIIDAAGFVPCRILPVGDSPDRAGQLLHDTLCPHVKRVLDRAMAGEIPDLAGMVFMNSCDAMRRLADAWKAVRDDIPSVLVDLPVAMNPLSQSFFAGELKRLVDALASWGGDTVSAQSLIKSIDARNQIADGIARLRSLARDGRLPGGAACLQDAYTVAATSPVDTTIAKLNTLADSAMASGQSSGVPVFVFGNVMPEAGAFTLLEQAGARVVDDDLCTGSRLFTRIETGDDDIFMAMARGLFSGSGCARTFDAESPGTLAANIARRAMACSAAGVIAYTAKFCDPYIARMPAVREALRAAGIPFLSIEGDCTLRSMGQQRTRIEAFIEMMR